MKTAEPPTTWIPLSPTNGGAREWRTMNIVAGWRLEFRDTNDVDWTSAGTHSSRYRAERAAR